jgi:hypothetical protein
MEYILTQENLFECLNSSGKAYFLLAFPSNQFNLNSGILFHQQQRRSL